MYVTIRNRTGSHTPILVKVLVEWLPVNGPGRQTGIPNKEERKIRTDKRDTRQERGA